MRNAIIILIITILGCSPSPRKIDFGKELCAFCKMAVVDRQHAAQAVSTTSKVYVFDAIECLINWRMQNQSIEPALQLVTTYDQPGVLQDAAGCTYLISPSLPSPMGANLTAFSNPEKASAYDPASWHTWDDLPAVLEENGVLTNSTKTSQFSN